MSELQLGLLAIGAAVVAAVFLYNKWQERRYRREVQAGFGSRHADVLMGVQGAPDRAFRADYADPALGLDGQAGASEDLPRGLSEALDFIVPIETPEEVAGAVIASAAAVVRDRCAKAVFWEGFDAEHDRWEALAPDRSYFRLRAGMQLVDRRGAANADELAEFGAAIEEAAASLDLLATVPPSAPALNQATHLDQFCGEADIRVAVHIRSDAVPFPGSRLAALARSLGFDLDEAEGRFTRRERDGRALFAIVDFDAVPFDREALSSRSLSAVTFELDVPHTPRGAVGRFRELAQALAQGLNARIVDDNGQPLGPGAFDAIEARVQAVHSSMEARGIVPGGALALRLFS